MFGNVPQLRIGGDNLKALKAAVDAALAGTSATAGEKAAAGAAIMDAAHVMLTHLGFALSETREKELSKDLNAKADASYGELS